MHHLKVVASLPRLLARCKALDRKYLHHRCGYTTCDSTCNRFANCWLMREAQLKANRAQCPQCQKRHRKLFCLSPICHMPSYFSFCAPPPPCIFTRFTDSHGFVDVSYPNRKCPRNIPELFGVQYHFSWHSSCPATALTCWAYLKPHWTYVGLYWG